MAISSTVVAKLGGNVEYVALDGGDQKSFSVNLPAGTWLMEIGGYSASTGTTFFTIMEKQIITMRSGSITCVINGGAVSFDGGDNARWTTGVAIKLD